MYEYYTLFPPLLKEDEVISQASILQAISYYIDKCHPSIAGIMMSIWPFLFFTGNVLYIVKYLSTVHLGH